MKIVILFTTLVSSLAFAGGLAVGNGGDIALCNGSYLSFDYIIGQFERQDLKYPVPVSPLQASYVRIYKVIEKGAPELKESFAEFTRLIENQDASKKYIWQKVGENDLDQVYDEDFPSHAFHFCRGAGLSGIEFIQAIVRKPIHTPSGPKFLFLYDKGSILRLKNAVQKSFLLVHEWLWNICPSAPKVRQINYFLHSKSSEEASAEQIRLEFQKSCPIRF